MWTDYTLAAPVFRSRPLPLMRLLLLDCCVCRWARSAVRTVTGSRPLLLEGGEGAPLLSDEERQALHDAIEYDATIAQVRGHEHGPLHDFT
jgi:hypothetical protein